MSHIRAAVGAGHERRGASLGRHLASPSRNERRRHGRHRITTLDFPHPRGDEETRYRTHHTRLLRLIAHDVSARPQVIEDACAFAWAELLARQPERTSIVGWLRVVARREAIRLARHDRATVSMRALEIEPPSHRARATSCPTGSASDHCEAVETLAAVAGLPERKRLFLTLKVAGYSYAEIAAQLGVSWLTVNRQLVRARAAARFAREGR